MGRFDLVPVGENAEQALSVILEAFGRSRGTLAECLDGDAAALSAGDLNYFSEQYYGCVPNYATFVRYLNKLPAEQRDEFNEAVAEIEAGRTLGTMRGIASKDEFEPGDKARFGMLNKINNIYEKRIDRIDRRRRDRGVGEARGVDMAARLISALSNADLLKVKGKVEAINAEYKEVAE